MDVSQTERISAGSFDLNKWLYGGYEKGVITMIAGPPGSGKTNFCILATCSQAKKGNKIIFIHGVCGTGKSGIALNIARKLGKTSIVVPIKNLQEQYKKDYGGIEGEGGKYILNEAGKKLQIHVITGRKNHVCKFMQDDIKSIPVMKSEIDSKLNDIFEGKREELAEKKTLGQKEKVEKALGGMEKVYGLEE